ncbi:f1f0 ATP synthase assembly protein [Niveomyces insectorum RCEF 264]|uniref:F1f0 ATP synthase assembly protein n=1 Tax=Niveomyces insectorum RCEF 264 TaxID=1081102 RepID=A0A167ZAL3_9HYPO|nr:f1f0 ATP synthase assembly protein [Niveomyces insectorum RCEF 264]
MHNGTIAAPYGRPRRQPYSTDVPFPSSSSSSSSDATTATTSSTRSSTTRQDDVLARYQKRLADKARDEGVPDIEALRAAYADKIQALRRNDTVVLSPDGRSGRGNGSGSGSNQKAASGASTTPAEGEVRRSTPPAPQTSSSSSSASASSPATAAGAAAAGASSSSSTTPRGPRPLSSFIELDKARKLPAEELTAIWRLRFAADPLSLCAVVPAPTYAAMEAAARARPQFVLPVPHPEQGAEVHFLQWTFDDSSSSSNTSSGTNTSTVLFTQLAEYKLRGEFAQPHTTVTHYTDLATDCGVVLMHGQVAEGRGVSVDNAQWLVMCLQRFYGAWSIPGSGVGVGSGGGSGGGIDEGARARRLLLQWFAAGDPQFTIERLMEEAEKLA